MECVTKDQEEEVGFMDRHCLKKAKNKKCFARFKVYQGDRKIEKIPEWLTSDGFSFTFSKNGRTQAPTVSILLEGLVYPRLASNSKFRMTQRG